MHIAPPQFIDNLYEYEGFVFKGDRKRNKDPNPFPTMQDMVDDFGGEFINSLDRDSLAKTCKVTLQDAEGGVGGSWPLSKCIQWELQKDDMKCVLSEGVWYKIDEAFHQEVEAFFNAAVVDDLGLPEMPGNLKKEADYNAHVSQQLQDVVLFDLGHPAAKRKSICVDGNEICDLYDVVRKRFIHVKSGKAASSISHLLRQGSFSAQMLNRVVEERNTFRGYLFAEGYQSDWVPEPFDAKNYTVDL